MDEYNIVGKSNGTVEFRVSNEHPEPLTPDAARILGLRIIDAAVSAKNRQFSGWTIRTRGEEA